MSDQIPSNIDIDPEETSWEVLSDNSSSSSIENLTTELSNQYHEVTTEDNDLNPIVIQVNKECKDEYNVLEEKALSFNVNSSPKKFLQSFWKKLKSTFRKRVQLPSYFTILSLTAFALIIISLIVLFCLLRIRPLISNEQYTEIGGNDIMLNAFNITPDIMNESINHSVIADNTFTTDFSSSIEDNVCFIEEAFKVDNDVKFNLQNGDIPILLNNADQYFLKNRTNNFLKFLKEACLVPSMYLLFCSLFKDLLLVMILQQLEKKMQLIPPINNSSNADKPIEKIMKRTTETDNLNEFVVKDQPDEKFELKPIVLVTDPNFVSSDNILPNDKLENGKSECERRFEDLDTEWKTVGKSHRQKIQEIKEEFKSQVFRIKEKEKVSSIRKQKIQLVRDRYTQKLRKDREKYFLQLRKIKDERQRTLNEVCRKKPYEIQEYEARQKKNDYLRQSPKLPKNLQRLVTPKFLGNELENSLDLYSMQQFKENYDFWKNKTILNQTRKSPIYLEDKIKLSKENMENEFSSFNKNTTNLDKFSKPKRGSKGKLAAKEIKKSNKLEFLKAELNNPRNSLHIQNLDNRSKDFLLIANKSIDEMTKNKNTESIFSKFEGSSEKSVTDKASNFFKNVETNDNENNSNIMLYRPEFSPLFGTKRKNNAKGNTSRIPISSRENKYVSSTQNSQSVMEEPEINNKDQSSSKSDNKITSITHNMSSKENLSNLFSINNADIFNETPSDMKFKDKPQVKPMPLRKILKSRKNEAVSKPFQSKSENFSLDDPANLKQDKNEFGKDDNKQSDPHTSESSLTRPNTFCEPRGTESEFEEVENELSWLMQEVPDKRDLYRVLFGKKGMMVKKKEKSILEKQYMKSPVLPILLSKNDPKVPKKINVFKGKL